jgi:hypothetical protein
MLSVVLATRDRAGRLRRTLDALLRLQQPRDGWHLVAVDNGSRDSTSAVLADYRARLPMTVVHEPRPGRSAALNAAIPNIQGDHVLFLDDDIEPQSDWLPRHAAAAAGAPDYAVFGGRIVPQWEVEPPRWIRDWADLALCYGAHADLADGPCPFYLVFGGNMAMRAEVFRRGLRFDPVYGPNGGRNYVIGCETDFVRRAEHMGFRAWHCRTAVARHFVPKAHFRWRWVLDRARNFGRSQYRMDGPAFRALRAGSDAETAARLRAAIAEQRRNAWRAVLAGNAEARFRACWQMSFLAGLALEHAAATRRGARA